MISLTRPRNNAPETGECLPGWQRFYFNETMGSFDVEQLVSDRPSISKAMIWNVNIRKELRGCGHGTQMMAEAMLFLKRKGVNQIWLNVNTWNTPAIRLYRSLGFQEAKRLDETTISMVFVSQ